MLAKKRHDTHMLHTTKPTMCFTSACTAVTAVLFEKKQCKETVAQIKHQAGDDVKTD